MDMEDTQESAQETNEFAGLPPSIENKDTGEESETAGDSPEPQEERKATTQQHYRERVDLSGLPDEIRRPIEGRINHLTKLMGSQERKFHGELSQWRDVAEQQSRLIEELQSATVSVVDHLQNKSLDDAESHWKSTMRAAYESGDVNGQMEANDKLIEIRTQKALLKQQQKTQKPQPKQEKKVNGYYPNSAVEIGSHGLSDGDITQEDYRALEAWQEEYDESGESLRPWAVKGHPKHQQALIEAVAVFKNPQYSKMTFDQKLLEIDRRMGTKKSSNSQSVLRGGLTGAHKMQKITLSPEIERLAIRQKFGGPKAKSDADHIEAYRKQMELVRSKKGKSK